MTTALSKSNLLVLSIDGAVTLRQKELDGLQTAGMGRHHQQRVARLVSTELVGMTQQCTAYQLVLYQQVRSQQKRCNLQ